MIKQCIIESRGAPQIKVTKDGDRSAVHRLLPSSGKTDAGCKSGINPVCMRQCSSPEVCFFSPFVVTVIDHRQFRIRGKVVHGEEFMYSYFTPTKFAIL
jgi:hypothetical protein